MAKSSDAFRTISEVSEWLETPSHVLRFWESKFTQVKPVKRAGGRRYYRPEDMALIGGLKKLLHEDGLTIRGAQKVLKEKGVAHVAAMSRPVEVTCDLETTEEPPAPRPEPEPEQVTEVTPKVRRDIPTHLNEDPADNAVAWQPGLLAAVAKAKASGVTDPARVEKLLARLTEIAHRNG